MILLIKELRMMNEHLSLITDEPNYTEDIRVEGE